MLWYMKRECPEVNKAKFLIKTHESLLSTLKKYGVNNRPYDKPHISVHDLIFLLNFETSRSIDFQISDSHMVAWIIAYFCGIRAHSLGQAISKGRLHFLAWKHIKIVGTRLGFDRIIEFHNLKT